MTPNKSDASQTFNEEPSGKWCRVVSCRVVSCGGNGKGLVPGMPLPLSWTNALIVPVVNLGDATIVGRVVLLLFVSRNRN